MKFSILNIFSILCLLSMVETVNAQDKIGLMGGLSQAKYRTGSVVQITGTYQWSSFVFAGISVEENLSSKWKLNVFLQYAQKGTKVDLSNVGATNTLNYKLHYVDFLPSIEFKPMNFLGLYAGGSIGYNFKATLSSSPVSSMTPSQDLTSSYKNITSGSLLGLRLYFGKIAVHGHWNRDFRPNEEFFATDANGNLIGLFKSYNNSIQAGVTWYL